MDMGKRIREARLEAGLSQTQLSRNLISRNMLSLIESGSAKPSLSTLEELAQRLKKPVGFFFGENTEVCQERAQVESAWKAYEDGSPAEAARLLGSLKNGERFRDVPILRTMILLELSQQALEEKRYPYAKQLLLQAGQEPEILPELKRKRLLLQGRLPDEETMIEGLPAIDEELLLRAGAALDTGHPERAAQLLEAAEDKTDSRWAMLRGRAYLLENHFKSAARCFHQAEGDFPKETAPYLEQCYRELEDFKQAYFYACRQK